MLDAPEPGAPATGPAAAAGLDPAHEPAALRELDSPFTVVASLTPLGSRAGVVVASHTEGWQVAVLDPDGGEAEVVRRGRHIPIDPAYISRPEPIVFPTEGGLTAHANYYPPANPDFVAPAGELPPLLVIVHGGPTSSHDAKLDLDVQYWTSRGIAVVAVNYGGSTGYGRAYRERLKGEWGVVDTVDAINAARYLIARGDADPARVGIRGGSAGGYTTLNALTRFDFFSAGASLFGLADLEAFATGGTHKFESQYLESLVGPYPERRDVYRERSPIHHVDDLSCPVILLQGLEDAIVPPHQAEIIVEALRAQGAALRLPRVRGRAARLPQGGEHHPRRGGGAVLLRARVGVHAGRRDRAGGDREPGLTRARVTVSLRSPAEERREGDPIRRGVYSNAMRIRTVSLVALGVAGVIAAIAILAAPAFAASSSGPPRASTGVTLVKKPPVVKKYIRYGAGRKAQTADYGRRHYRQHTYWLTDPKVIVLHHTAGSTWQSAWYTFDANTAYNGEKPGVSAQFIVHKDGTIYQCMPLSLRARHAIGMNWKSIGIEFVQEAQSGKDGHWMDRQILNRDRQMAAGLRLVRYLQARFGITTANVIGHAMANDSRYFRDYTGIKNGAGDWFAAEVRLFRSRL